MGGSTEGQKEEDTTMKKFRIKHVAPGCVNVIHPDGYWIGPGLGDFRSCAEAMDWLHGYIRRWGSPHP